MTLREQITRDEGLRLKPYHDQVGKITIGVGRNLEDKGISEDEAYSLLDHDLEDVTTECSTLVYWSSLNEARQAVLAGMCFNMGFAGLLGFRLMLGHVALGQWPEAAAELRNSAADHEEPNRIERWARQLELGDWV